jgi:hypothetical protein
MRRWIFSLCIVIALPACAGTIAQQATTAAPPVEQHVFYEAAHRLIRFADGSDLLFYFPNPPEGGAPLIDALMVSSRGRDEDRAFRLSTFIPNEVLEGTFGQLTSAAMSEDHQWLAFVGGWAGARDHRGHNGVFLLKEQKSGAWRVQSWFDVPGVDLGEIAFGPDDTLLLTAQKGTAEGGSAPMLTLFSFSGQNLGWFVDSPHHGNWNVRPGSRDARIVSLGNGDFAIYDPETSLIRYVHLALNGRSASVKQTQTVPIPFSVDHVNLVAFDARPDGVVTLARTIVESSRARTIVTRSDHQGRLLEEWQAPNVWKYGYAERSTFHGYSAPLQQPVEISTVSVK